MNWLSLFKRRDREASAPAESVAPAADTGAGAMAPLGPGGEAAFLRAVFDHAFDAIVVFDRHGCVRSANRAAVRMFGLPLESMLGRPFRELLGWNELEVSGDLDATPFGSVSTSEITRPDGSCANVEFSLACIGEGKERIYATILRDATERLQAEERARSSARRLTVSNRRLEELNAQLEEASRLKTEFLANTSHELRTPLNGIIGFLQLVLDGTCDSPEEERDFQEQALDCSKRLLGMINDVLDIAKIEAGKLTLDLQPVDVETLFEDVYRLTHVQAAQKGLKIRFEAPEDPQHRVRGDINKIKQVLINLVGNSLKFTPKGSVTVRALELTELGHYRFEVIDTGIGIAPDRQSIIFDKFTQGDGSSTRRFGGAGLGLAISRSLVEMMGGIIGVQSEGVGQGTRMYFSLPVWRGQTEKPSDDAPRRRIQGPSDGPLVLVVEDDPVFRKYTCTLLNKHGYRTADTDDAESAWILARQLKPLIMVLDYALASSEDAVMRTGWDLAERMSSDPRTRHVPLVFVTGFDSELREKLKTMTFARRPEHVIKPVEGKVLVDKIQELLGSTANRTIRTLLADDDPGVARYLRKVLPDDRFTIEITHDGEECLHVLRTRPNDFDLLLLDLQMPDVSGYDVLREITLSGSMSNVPVLVLTNSPETRSEEEKRLLEQGLVLDVLSKTEVHENPVLLPHIIDWHLQVVDELGPVDEPATNGDTPQARAA